MKLHVKPNAETGTWEIHDACGFLCKLESESTAALIVHAINVLPELVATLEMAEPAAALRRSGRDAKSSSSRRPRQRTRGLPSRTSNWLPKSSTPSGPTASRCGSPLSLRARSE